MWEIGKLITPQEGVEVSLLILQLVVDKSTRLELTVINFFPNQEKSRCMKASCGGKTVTVMK